MTNSNRPRKEEAPDPKIENPDRPRPDEKRKDPSPDRRRGPVEEPGSQPRPEELPTDPDIEKQGEVIAD